MRSVSGVSEKGFQVNRAATSDIGNGKAARSCWLNHIGGTFAASCRDAASVGWVNIRRALEFYNASCNLRLSRNPFPTLRSRCA